MLRETLDWRIKFQADDISGESVFENGKTGKVFVSGTDLQVLFSLLDIRAMSECA